jgi:hypothetical protein
MKVSIGRYRKDDKERKIKIQIDKFDTWNMDHTLALIALPMLKQLKETKHGSPYVKDEDLPEHLRFSETKNYDSQRCFHFYYEDGKDDLVHERWDWVMGEMIFAMEQIVKDDDSEFYIHPAVDGCESFQDHLNKIVVKEKELKAYHDRIDNGLRLFGTYYKGLWD